MTAAPGPGAPEATGLDIAALERRRRLSLRAALGALVLAVVAFPLGMRLSDIEGSETAETLAGAGLMAGLVGLIAAPWIVRAWQGFMRRRMVAAAVGARADIRHVDAERDPQATRALLSSATFTLGAFRDSGLIEAFESASVQHVLTGNAGGVPFAVAELALLDAKQYRMFGGVLASFELARPRPALTVVTRDRGVLGNLVAGAGGPLETLTLEDPEFEALFEVYGDDQVEGRVILTTTMLQRLKDLDALGHASGFACAFRGRHLLLAFEGMEWRCPPWRIVRPIDGWLAEYAAWLTGLVDLPRAIVTTLNLLPPSEARQATRTPVPPSRFDAVAINAGTPEVFSTSLFRIIGEGGMGAVYVMSGAVFGGLALVAARYGLTEGFSPQGFWYWWGLTSAGLGYGLFAIGIGLRQILRLVWKWKSPLRTMGRRQR